MVLIPFYNYYRSLRKLIFKVREALDEDRGKVGDFDLSLLIEPSSPVETMVFEKNVRYAPTRRFMDILMTQTSIHEIMIYEFYLWNFPKLTNPFLNVRCFHTRPNTDSYSEYRREKYIICEDLKLVISCLTTLWTIYLAQDQGFFALIPSEIILQILVYTYHRVVNYYRGGVVTFHERQLRRLIQLASDRSKIRKETDTRKRLYALWIEDDIRSVCLNND